MGNNCIIIIGLTPQGLSLLRCLSRIGVHVIAFYQNPKNVGVYSKYGEKVQFHDINDLKSKIHQIVDELGYSPLCYITSGEILALILQEYPELYDQCKVSSGPYRVVELLAHKDKMYELAIKKGFTVARYTTLDNYKEGSFSYPCFMKRNYEIPLFFKVAKIETREMMASYINKIKEEEKQNILVQDWINIPKEDVVNISAQSFYCNGLSKGHYLSSQLRRLKKGITSYIEEITDNETVSNISGLIDSFMQDLDYSGFAEFEFMYDKRNDKLYFIEVNTRTCGLQSSLANKFTNLAQIAANPNLEEMLLPVERPVNWMNIIRDIRSRIQNRDFSHITDILHCSFDIFDKQDLKPFFKQFL